MGTASRARVDAQARRFERAVSEEVRRARERAGMNPAALARAAGMSKPALLELESGARGLRLALLYAAAVGIGLDVEDLLLAARRRLLEGDGRQWANGRIRP